MIINRLAVIALSDPAPSLNEVAQAEATAAHGCLVSVYQGREVGTRSDPQLDPVGVRLLLPEQVEVQLLVQAVRSRVPLEIDIGGRPLVPDSARRSAELAIQQFADLLAIRWQCRRRVESASVRVIVTAEEDEVIDRGETAETTPTPPGRAFVMDDISTAKTRHLLADRITSGGALLADSLSSETPVARVRDLLRLFEAAFGKGINALVTPLYEFLTSSPIPMSFSKREIQSWVGLRGGVMHADRRVAQR